MKTFEIFCESSVKLSFVTFFNMMSSNFLLFDVLRHLTEHMPSSHHLHMHKVVYLNSVQRAIDDYDNRNLHDTFDMRRTQSCYASFCWSRCYKLQCRVCEMSCEDGLINFHIVWVMSHVYAIKMLISPDEGSNCSFFSLHLPKRFAFSVSTTWR